MIVIQKKSLPRESHSLLGKSVSNLLMTDLGEWSYVLVAFPLSAKASTLHALLV